MKPLPPLLKIFKLFKKGRQLNMIQWEQDRTDIMPDPEPKVSSSPNFKGVFLSRIEEFGEILHYHSNITQESWQRGLDNINSIYKKKWDNFPTNDADKLLPIGTKGISNQELKMPPWLEEVEIAG
ncbi:hypothetical protein O181_020666 [Austropuccinia psidii MF-1]|uniref:Uncharacterized protein n=1 Tax=Austropuccinia psidii MF-1 TaxID=1389203 RepID=A0A9Q3CDX6_9BASI|nr:hypothetical protein [Austropuccinia psidii MF-1]